MYMRRAELNMMCGVGTTRLEAEPDRQVLQEGEELDAEECEHHRPAHDRPGDQCSGQAEREGPRGCTVVEQFDLRGGRSLLYLYRMHISFDTFLHMIL